MEKSYVYILNVMLLFGMISCQNDKSNYLLSLTDEQKNAKIKELEYYKDFYYQGNTIQQAYWDTLAILSPENEYYYREKSVPHSKIGDYHIAFPLLEKAMEIDPKEALYYTSWLMTDLYKDYERALEYLVRYDDLRPDKVDYAWGDNVNFLKGEVLQALGRHEEAVEEFTKAIKEEGLAYAPPSVFPYRGISYAKLGQYDKAIADFDQGIRVYDKSSLSYYYKGLTLLEIGKKEAAITCILKAKELVEKGYKKSDPYKEVYNEIYAMQIEDTLKEIEE